MKLYLATALVALYITSTATEPQAVTAGLPGFTQLRADQIRYLQHKGFGATQKTFRPTTVSFCTVLSQTSWLKRPLARPLTKRKKNTTNRTTYRPNSRRIGNPLTRIQRQRPKPVTTQLSLLKVTSNRNPSRKRSSIGELERRFL